MTAASENPKELQTEILPTLPCNFVWFAPL